MHKDEPFFIGWSNSPPASILRFGLACAAGLLLVLGLLGYGLGSAIDDPSRNLFAGIASAPQDKPQGWLGDQELTGVLTHRPSPVLHLPATPAAPFGRAILLSGDGKRGATVPADGVGVTLVGGLFRRSGIEMLVVGDEAKTAPAPMAIPAPIPLGRWRAVGEICDGKCYPGGMTPGFGLAHRACAALCCLSSLRLLQGRVHCCWPVPTGGRPRRIWSLWPAGRSSWRARSSASAPSRCSASIPHGRACHEGRRTGAVHGRRSRGGVGPVARL